MGLNRTWCGLVGLALAWGVGCGPGVPVVESVKAPGGEWFEEMTERAGIGFVQDPGATGLYRMPEHIGSGGAFIDFDRDGLLDIYLVQNGGPGGPANQLYRQGAGGRFENATAGSGLGVAGYGMGVAVGDVNNDGWDDVLLTEYGGVRLFLNRKDGSFQPAPAGLDNPRWAASAAFFDYDRDGWLDLVVANYVDSDPTHQCYDARGFPDYCGPAEARPLITRLFRNRSGGGGPVHFEDRTVPAGLAAVPGPGLGVVCADFNGDRWPDFLVADDESPNRLFINVQDGTFREEGVLRGIGYDALGRALANMGIGLGDVDGNGEFDIFVTHLATQPHNLWMQGPRGLFRDGTAEAGLMRMEWRGTGFGAVLADLDRDGFLDLALVNGRVRRESADALAKEAGGAPKWEMYGQRDQLFANNGSGVFGDVSGLNPAFCGRALTGRGLICGDYDNDGALDLLVTSVGAPARLFRGRAGMGRHWLLIRVIDEALGGRDAYGAEVRVRAGDRVWWRLASPFYSYMASNDPRVHIGLGGVAAIDSIEVIWPDGDEELFEGGGVDRLVVLRKGRGRSGVAE